MELVNCADHGIANAFRKYSRVEDLVILQDLSKYRKIGDSFLFSESDSTQAGPPLPSSILRLREIQADVPGTCQARPVHGMEASPVCEREAKSGVDQATT